MYTLLMWVNEAGDRHADENTYTQPVNTIPKKEIFLWNQK
jgi:hypothetical protein